MRTLLTRTLPLLGLILAALSTSSVAQSGLPRPIGQLSDYGAALNSSGREEINARIAQTDRTLGVKVYILASWESPQPDVESFANAVFSAWGLGSSRSLLVVFLRTGTEWSASVVASASVRTQYGAIADSLEHRMADLILHDRVEEAMLALFDGLDEIKRPTKIAPPKKTSSAGSHGLSPVVSILLVAAGTAALVILIQRRVCPRCGFFLRASRRRGFSRTRGKVYSCSRCGFRRQR
ncbi:MAG: TPM domain-containing protein [Candidatus Bipolaricaulota bacterium]|nr:TPM domain-containing protein [Candidatus Bipolaricaulota bacterium]